MDNIAQGTTLRSVLLTKYYSGDQMKRMIWASKVLVGRLEGKDHLAGVNVNAGVVLKWIFKK
jgi:hypothetical protein